MNQVQVLVIDNFGSSDRHYIDTYEGEGIKLTYLIADIRDISKRNTTYSKTIKIPGTKNNNDVMTHIFDINKDMDNNISFKPNKKTKCFIMADYLPIIEGSLQLLQINVLDDLKVEYEIVVFGELLDFVKNVGDKLLVDNVDSEDDLNFPQTLTLTNSGIINSWDNNADDGFTWPLIDYGYGWDETTINGDNKISPFKNIWPCLYVKTILDEIFSKAGFFYQSSFLESDFFKKLIILNNSNPITETLVVEAENSSDITIPVSSARTNLDFDTANYDPSSQWVLVGGVHVFRPALPGVYRIAFEFNGSITGGGFYHLAVTNVSSTVVAPDPNIWRIETQSTFPQNFSGITQPEPVAGTDYYIKLTTFFAGLTIGAGSKIKIYRFPLDDLNFCLPLKVKQIDFITSIVKMFNLYIDVDRDNPKKFIIEPREDYYALGSTLDWSQKMDKASDYTLQPLPELSSKNLTFTYTNDSDFLNKNYTGITKEIYGEFKYEIDTDFTTGETKINPLFSPTPLKKVTGFGNLVIPMIYDITKVDNVDQVKPTTYNPRILIHSGTVDLNSSKTISLLDSTNFDPTTLNPVVTTNTSYPYTGMYEIPEVLDIDGILADSINFANIDPNTNNIDSGSLTLNLFDRYYSKYISEIINPNSKLLTGMFLLSSQDMHDIKFNDLIYLDIDNNPSYWRLNKIIDYDPTTTDLTKVELIKTNLVTLLESPIRDRLSPQDFTTNPDGGGSGGEMIVQRGSNNTIDSNFVSIIGFNNTIKPGSNNTSITGSRNSIAPFAPNTNINGDDNNIQEGLYNSTIIGSNNNIESSGLMSPQLGNNYIKGDSNTIATDCYDCSIIGNNNEIGTNSSPEGNNSSCVIIGDNNIIDAGLTNVTVIGNNITATESNKVYTDALDALSVKSGGSAVLTSESDPIFTSKFTTISGSLRVSGVTGFVVPRLSTTERESLSVVGGEIVYDTTLQQFFKYTTSWIAF